ncbi:MAG TPA: hypothetical protein VJT09_17530 [Pyrinomonadaceae bacterium]|nr:hypothetical protein [Pyrinomonadaceae bacterium]
MKQLANSLAQLAAIIMILITLAVSSAAISQWAGGDSGASINGTARGTTAGPQSLVATSGR